MKITRKINILVKTERKFVQRQPLMSEPLICEICAETMFSAKTSADFLGFSSRVIYRLIEAEKINFVETEENEIYVCPNCVKSAGNQSNKNLFSAPVGTNKIQ